MGNQKELSCTQNKALGTPYFSYFELPEALHPTRFATVFFALFLHFAPGIFSDSQPPKHWKNLSNMSVFLGGGFEMKCSFFWTDFAFFFQVTLLILKVSILSRHFWMQLQWKKCALWGKLPLFPQWTHEVVDRGSDYYFSGYTSCLRFKGLICFLFVQIQTGMCNAADAPDKKDLRQVHPNASGFFAANISEAKDICQCQIKSRCLSLSLQVSHLEIRHQGSRYSILWWYLLKMVKSKWEVNASSICHENCWRKVTS